MKIGEDKLLPLVRAAPYATLIVTNGFSCREQIEQGAGRQTLHIAQLALRALTQAEGEQACGLPRDMGACVSAS
jgi:hypothetical protein